MSSFLSLTTGDYVLNFFKEFIGTPAILIGLFAFVGLATFFRTLFIWTVVF